MTIVIAVLVFGFLIFIHELGHFTAARIFKVKVNEFSIGMGPKLISKTSKKTGTAYSLRLLPIGGFVSMAGEDEESDEEGALNSKPVWQRMIIIAAGAFMNILVGVLAVFIIVVSTRLPSNTVAKFREGSVLPAQGLEVGDTIVSIDGKTVRTAHDMREYIMFDGTEECDVVVLRDGSEVTLPNVRFATASEGKLTVGMMDFYVKEAEKTVGSVLVNTFYYAKSSVTTIWKSLLFLVTGKVGVDQMSGPVGVTSAIGDAAKRGLPDLLDLAALIALNLGIVNMLPFPALDGGRFVFLLFELITRKKVPRKVEGYIHFAGLVLLMGFMILITYKDILKLFS